MLTLRLEGLNCLNVGCCWEQDNFQYAIILRPVRTSLNIGTVGSNQINEQYTFDAQTGLLTNQKAIRNGTTTLLDVSYDYGRNGSFGTLNGKTGQVTKVTDNLDAWKNKLYVFDAVGRLKWAYGSVESGSDTTSWSQNYTYDRYGNRTSITVGRRSPVASDGIPSLAYDTANNRITTAGFEYDVAGNQTRALADDQTNVLRYEYDAANRLVAIKDDSGNLIQSQQFGAGNERIGLTDYVSNQTTYFNGATEYLELSGNGVLAWSRSLVYFGESILSTITPNGTGGEYIEFNHPDRLGTKLITNQAGGTSYSQSTLPFGTPLNSESTVTTYSKRFTSYERSARTGLDYANNRTYDSKQGRFTQVDPIGMGDTNLANPQSLNLYAYCQNDPINHSDPSGLGFFSFLKTVFKWVMIAIAVAAAIITVVGAFAGAAAMATFLGNTLLGQILGFIANIPGMIGGSVFGGTAASIAGTLGFTEGAAALAANTINGMLGWALLAGAKATVSAISSFAARANKPKGGCPPKSAGATFFFAGAFDIYEKALNDMSAHNGHEEGGWIYQDAKGNLKAVLKDRHTVADPQDSAIQIFLGSPPKIKGMRVVGTFHTHTNDVGVSGEAVDLGNGMIRVSGDYLPNYQMKIPGMVLTRPHDGTGQGYRIYGPGPGFMNVGMPKGCNR